VLGLELGEELGVFAISELGPKRSHVDLELRNVGKKPVHVGSCREVEHTQHLAAHILETALGDTASTAHQCCRCCELLALGDIGQARPDSAVALIEQLFPQ